MTSGIRLASSKTKLDVARQFIKDHAIQKEDMIMIGDTLHDAEIAHDIVESADHYAFRISGKPALTQPGVERIDDVNVIADLARLKVQGATVDSMLLDCVKLDEVQIEFLNYEDKLVKRWRSTILSQAIHHATEHRAQIASALEAKGFTPVNLDDLDLWSFERETGS